MMEPKKMSQAWPLQPFMLKCIVEALRLLLLKLGQYLLPKPAQLTFVPDLELGKNMSNFLR